MRKKILLISYNFSPELTGIGKYNGEMLAWFVKQGYDCSVITSYPYYPSWRVEAPYDKRKFWYFTEKFISEDGDPLTIYRCPQYVPANPSGLKRILLECSFLITAFFKLLQLLFDNKFDYIITVAPSFQVGLLGIMYKKLHKAKLLYHIQDLQIEAARDLGLIQSKKLIQALFRMEKYIFNQSDGISTISSKMADKVQEKACKTINLFPNWADTKAFFPIANRNELKEKYGFATSDKIILYAGAIGEKQGLESLLYVAEKVKPNQDIKFIICGSGPYKEKLQVLSDNLRLANVFFFPLQPTDQFNQFLNMADLHLVIQKSSASDLVMPSKLSTILAVGGLALVTTNTESGLYSLIKKHNIGLLIESDNDFALQQGILQGTSQNFIHICENARAYAENFLSIEKIMPAYEEFMLQVNPGYSGSSFPKVIEEPSMAAKLGVQPSA